MEEQSTNNTEFQFLNVRDNQKIVFNGIARLLEPKDLDDIKNNSSDFWWNENDCVTFFSYNLDGTYFCERKKIVFDYRIREQKELVYQFEEASSEQVKEFRKVLLDKYEELQIKYLQDKKDYIRSTLEQTLGYINLSLRTVRRQLLSITDFMFTSDYVWKDPTEKDLWIKYRQALRDLTETPEWLSGDFLKIRFPISPNDYKKLYPNGEVEYLDVMNVDDNQYVNKAIATWKAKMIRNIDNLNLPTLLEEVDVYEGKNSDSYEDYKLMIDQLNENLKKIDATININDAIVIDALQNPDDCPDCTISMR